VIEGFQKGHLGRLRKESKDKANEKKACAKGDGTERAEWEIENQKRTEFSDSLDNDNLGATLTQPADAVWSFWNRGIFGAWPLSKK
jgi:hypothetical protein